MSGWSSTSGEKLPRPEVWRMWTPNRSATLTTSANMSMPSGPIDRACSRWT